MIPLSGENYLIGRSILNAAQLAIEKTNQKYISISIIDTGNENELINIEITKVKELILKNKKIIVQDFNKLNNE